MGKVTNISWTDHTFNPWIGCAKVSPECDRCYAEIFSVRYGVEWGPKAPRKPLSEEGWATPLKWNQQASKNGVRRRVFCASLADVFDSMANPEWRRRLFDLIIQTPHLDWLLLTKRPQLIREQLEEIGYWDRLPLPNVWLGFSAGDQKRFDQRWPIVRDIPALVRFCSYEPALGPIQLPEDVTGNLHWLICGGETDPTKYEARPMEMDWPRSICRQCVRKDVAFFFKQWGNWIPNNESMEWASKTSALFKEKVNLLDGITWEQFPKARPIELPHTR